MKYFLILKFAIEKNIYIYNAVWIELGNIFLLFDKSKQAWWEGVVSLNI